MERKELQIKDKMVVLLEQPTKFVLELERRFGDKEVVGYCKEILKYPANINPKIDELIEIPNIIKVGELEYKTTDEEGKVRFDIIEKIFFSLQEKKANSAYVGEFFIKLCGKKIDCFKYKELVEIGTEVFKQIGEFAYLLQIRESFRDL